jgi:chromosome segregation protein
LYLRSLTIKGFKSFARKTVLEFQPGVTIIVGPNGSGKSNIADAVMWVLGEQSPTSLRGNRMEDVIFSGSASHKPVNLAEVTLTLDNSGNDFPLEYSEINVSRNVVRGGDSEYWLNNSSCRLLDIQELLSDAGVGRTLNSVISQGQLDEVLTCRAEERRDYIEEAGGLLKYRRRREKALRRLGRMEEELLRTNDVMREVRRQLRPLQRQAGRLEQYQSLVNELADSQLRLDVAKLRKMQKEWQQHQDIQEERRKRLEVLDKELADKTRSGGELDRRQSEWRTKEAGLRENLYRLVSLHEQLKAMLTVWDEKMKRVPAGALAPDMVEIDALEAANRQLEDRRDDLQARLEGQRAEDAEMAQRLSDVNVRLNEVTRQAAALEARIEVLQSEESELRATGAQLLEERKAELKGLEGELKDHQTKAARLQGAVSEKREKVGMIQAEVEGMEKEREGILGTLRELEREQAMLVSTLQLIWRLDTGHWDVMNTSYALQKQDPTGGSLGGTLAEALKIEPEYEQALMSFLGPWAFGLLAKDNEAIIKAIDHLKEEQLGQSLFFRYAQGAAPKEVAGPGRAPKGTIRARDVVSVPRWFSEAVDALLNGVYIAPDLRKAFDLAEKHPDLVFLCPEGDVVFAGTLVKGGSSEISQVHLKMTAGRREVLEESLDESRGKMEAAELESRASVKRLKDANRRLLEARSGFQDALEATAVESALLSSCEERIASLKEEVVRLSGEGEEGPAARVDIDKLKVHLESLQKEQSQLSSALQEAESAHRKANDAVAVTEARLAALQGELESGKASLKAATEAAAFTEDARAEAPAKTEADVASLVELHHRLVAQVSGLRDRVRVQLDDGAVEVQETDRALRLIRDEVSKMQDQHEELRDQIHTEDLARAELKIMVEQLVERIVDGYKVPLDFALKQYPEEEPSPELEEKVAALTAQLEHIGPVNPEAIAERQALEERFDFLKTQIDDIEKSKTQLRKIVRQIDREIEEKFRATVEEINEHFKEIFSTLFPNGSAELRLTDPDNLLETGVEILAQPEGKRLRRISLLSGGETSLTALGFFFALFKVRPSPFYFLDEVEAALDDVNLHRFLDLVKQFKDESQLILITHQKRSMEIADILYGVTMQEDGISRVVSQKVAS